MLLKSKFKPVCIGDNRTGKENEQCQQYHATAATSTRSASAEAEIILQPIKEPTEHCQL